MPSNWEQKRTALIQWIESATNLTAIWQDQDSSRATLPYATLKILVTPSKGHDEIRQRENDTKVDIIGQREITVDCNVLGPGALEKITCARLSLSREDVRGALDKADLAFQQAADPQDLSEVLETLTEPRWQMDVIFNTFFTTEEDLGKIEQVDLTGEVGTHTTNDLIDAT